MDCRNHEDGNDDTHDGKALLFTDFNGLRQLNLETRPEFEASLLHALGEKTVSMISCPPFWCGM